MNTQRLITSDLGGGEHRRESGAKLRIIFADVHGPVLGKDQASANLSLLYLAGYLERYAPHVSMRYLSQKPALEEHLELIRTFEADVYAISFTSYSASVAFEMIRTVKRCFPKVVVVIGGPHVMTHAEHSLRSSGADLCVLGEGEVTFFEIIDSFHELSSRRSTIQGLAYIERDRLMRNPARPLVDDLDTLPFPKRELLKQADFAGTSYSRATPNTEVIITRGCPLRCVFCANPVYRVEGGPLFRARSPQKIAEEVEQLYRGGYREIYFHSDELNVRLGWSIELCKALAALNHPDLYFQCNMRVVPMNEELAYWMKEANFWLVRVGIESANPRVLKGIKKRMSLEKIERACALWSQAGIKVFAFLMMFNAWEDEGQLEYETPIEVEETIRFAYRLWFNRRLNYVSWQYAVPVPGAELYALMVKYGEISDEYLPDENWRPYEHLPGLTRKQFNKVFRKTLRQSALMAISGGEVEWRNWRMISKKARLMLLGG